MDPKRLILDNANNQLALDVFFQINISPPRSRMPHYERLADQIFIVDHEGFQIFVRLIEIWFLPFSDICDMETLMFCGKRSLEWKFSFKESHPDITDETEMAIYCYQKEKV